VSNQSGTFEVYVAPFPGAETRFRVSTNGGTRPRWRRDGSEIFFRSPDNKLMAASVSVAAGHSLTVGEVKVLFDNEIIRAGSPSYAVSPDGQRFLVNTAAAAPMTVVLNWQAALKK
jgi:Tol biopolymer transport system component